MNSKLYVGNFCIPGHPRGFAFVTFSAATESMLAIKQMNGKELDGRALTINEAMPR